MYVCTHAYTHFKDTVRVFRQMYRIDLFNVGIYSEQIMKSLLTISRPDNVSIIIRQQAPEITSELQQNKLSLR